MSLTKRDTTTSDTREIKGAKRPAPVEKEWTVMVYMAGDNSLSEDMVTGLKGMMQFGPSTNINLVALYDGCFPSEPLKFFDFTTARPTRAGDPPLSTFSNSSWFPTNPNSYFKEKEFKLQDFVRKVKKLYPAKKYALILSCHSDGVIGKTILSDDNPAVSFNLVQLRGILEKALKDKKGIVKRLDLLGFDGCLMGMIEAAYELKGVADVMVASEGNIPASGWSYETVLSDLKGKYNLTPEEFAESIVRNYAQFNLDYSISGRSINVSAFRLLNLRQKESVYTKVQKLGKLLYDLLNLPVSKSSSVTESQALSNRLFREKFIEWITLSHQRSQTFMHSQSVDLLDFVYNLLLNVQKWTKEIEIILNQNNRLNAHQMVAIKIHDIFDAFVDLNIALHDKKSGFVLASCSVGAEYQFSQGMSVFMPWTRMAFNMIGYEYAKLKFNGRRDWLRFIRLYTGITMRFYRPKPYFDKRFESLEQLTFEELSHREVNAKEVNAKEVNAKGSEFYRFFSETRNYKTRNVGKTCADSTSFL